WASCIVFDTWAGVSVTAVGLSAWAGSGKLTPTIAMPIPSASIVAFKVIGVFLCLHVLAIRPSASARFASRYWKQVAFARYADSDIPNEAHTLAPEGLPAPGSVDATALAQRPAAAHAGRTARPDIRDAPA